MKNKINSTRKERMNMTFYLNKANAEKEALNFYINYIWKYVSTGTPEEIAAKRALEPARRQSMKILFKLSPSLQATIEGKIKKFLKARRYSLTDIKKAIDDIYVTVTSGAYTGTFTYGNAQKWLLMAIKYYIIQLCCDVCPCCGGPKIDFSKEKELISCYKAFPIDSVMIRNTGRKNILDIKFSGAPWTKCSSLSVIMKYLEETSSKMTKKGFIPFYFELCAWPLEKSGLVDKTTIFEP